MKDRLALAERIIEDWWHRNHTYPNALAHAHLADAIARALPAPYETITRFELIDEKGRAITRYDVDVKLSYQDEGRTLKVFLSPHYDGRE